MLWKPCVHQDVMKWNFYRWLDIWDSHSPQLCQWYKCSRRSTVSTRRQPLDASDVLPQHKSFSCLRCHRRGTTFLLMRFAQDSCSSSQSLVISLKPPSTGLWREARYRWCAIDILNVAQTQVALLWRPKLNTEWYFAERAYWHGSPSRAISGAYWAILGT